MPQRVSLVTAVCWCGMWWLWEGFVLLVLLCLGAAVTLDTVWKESSSTPLL